mmetsp:Transcript_24077/g.62807  ORF Transcript_24077/g.62807 Transcript_24077/m.62807 type:complete len:123 (+) Transcript_24077:1009-1377(+)
MRSVVAHLGGTAILSVRGDSFWRAATCSGQTSTLHVTPPMKTLTQIALRRYTRSTPPRDGVRQGRGASMRDVNSRDGARLGEGVLARSIVLEHSSHQRIWRPRLVQQRRCGTGAVLAACSRP